VSYYIFVGSFLHAYFPEMSNKGTLMYYHCQLLAEHRDLSY